MRLKDKVVIITGAAQGLGAAFAVGFAKEGASIVIGDIRDGKETVDAVEKSGGKAIYVKTDATKQGQCDALAKAAMDRFGSIDVLVNNAGLFPPLKPFMEITSEEWMRILEINTLPPFCCTKAVFPYMKAKGGHIINLSSQSIFTGAPGMPQYVASKGAIMAFTRCMAQELADYNINVNTIAPGFTHSKGADEWDKDTSFKPVPLDEIQLPMKCFKKPAFPEDIVGTAIYLASDDSRIVTGQLIVVDGGMTLY